MATSLGFVNPPLPSGWFLAQFSDNIMKYANITLLNNNFHCLKIIKWRGYFKVKIRY